MPALVDFNTIPQLYEGLRDRFAGQGQSALRYKDKGTKAWTDIDWDELVRRVEAMAGYLHSRGVRRGDRVAILSENRPEWAITDLATQILGAVNVALYTTLPAKEVAYILKDSEAEIFVVSTNLQLKKALAIFDECEALKEVVSMTKPKGSAAGQNPDWMTLWGDALTQGREAWDARADELGALGKTVQPDDLCALIYTSGTTGNPKGVMLTHANFCTNANAALQRLDFGPTDLHLSFLPLCHSFERTAGYHAIMSTGATIAYAESVETVAKNLPEVKPTVMISVPRLFERVYNVIAKNVQEGGAAKQKIFAWAVATGKKVAARKAQGKGAGPILGPQYALAHKLVFAKLHEKLGGRIRFAVSGGAALPAAIGEFFQAAGVTIVEGYGLTETSPVLAFNPLEAPRYGTVGHVLPGVTVGIMRVADGELLGQVDGDSYPNTLTTEEGEIVSKGPNTMRGYWKNETSTNEAIVDGWYHTGDIGRFTGGYLQITDRLKHMIVSKGGKNIYPGPIEEQFKTFPYIDQLMVVGEGREYLTALVVPNMEAVEKFAADGGIEAATTQALLSHKDVRAIFEKQFKTYSRAAASHERIRDFRLIAEPFTIENGMMTPTMKLKRRVIETQYADLIDRFYEGVV